MIKNKPLVSIVLPTFNGSKYIENAINSCIYQTLQDWELIIVDDASTDNTLQIIEKYTDKRIKIVRHNANRKLPAALNSGFNIACGKYFTWISDDNCFREFALEEMVKFLNLNPQIDLVYTDYSIINENNEVINKIRVADYKNLYEANGIGASFLYKRIIHEALNGYREEFFLAEDYDFWLRASSKFMLHPLHLDLYLYRVHLKSLSNEKLELVDRVVEKVLLDNLFKISWFDYHIKTKVYIRLLNISKKYKDEKKMYKYLYKALLTSPMYVFNNESYLLDELIYSKFKIENIKNKIQAILRYLKGSI